MAGVSGVPTGRSRIGTGVCLVAVVVVRLATLPIPEVELLFNMLMGVLGLVQPREEGRRKVSGVVAAVGSSDNFYF